MPLKFLSRVAISVAVFALGAGVVSAQEPNSTNASSLLITQDTLDFTDVAIIRYEKLVAAGGWRQIPKGPLLREGSTDSRVPLIRQRLYLTRDMKKRRLKSTQYDFEVAESVKRFQSRHGLKPTGIFGRAVLRTMNVSAKDRLQQLRINRQRLRTLGEKISGQQKYILVNIPSFELQAVENGRLSLASRVVVGKTSTPTPVVSTSVRAVNFFPYWHVPQSIANRALIPKIKKDLNYLSRERLRVYPTSGSGQEIDPRQINWWQFQGQRYVFRQDPGPHNALGLIRIDMPNKHIVYMHDTPLKKLFRYQARPFSAGCVRVQKIGELALWLAKAEPGWNRNTVRNTLDQGKQRTLKLSERVPVHFVYISAWSKSPNFIEFRSDIYSKDGKHLIIADNDGWDTQVTKVMP